MILYSQKDPRWAKDRMGTSSETLARSGCLVTSIAVGLTRFWLPTDPKCLNMLLTKAKGYDASGRLYFSSIRTVTKGAFFLVEGNPMGKVSTLYEVHINGTPASWRHWLVGIPGVLRRVCDPIDGMAKSLLLARNYEQTGRVAYLKRK